MILPKDVSFEKRARFLHDSLSRHPDSPEFAQHLSKHTVDITAGLRAHHDLLLQVYSDVDWMEGKDDDIKFHELVATMAFLYAVFAFGTLVCEHGWYSVRIDKAVLKKQYKKGGFSKRERHLEHHGFSLKYLSGQKECGSWRRASHLSLAYDQHPSLVPAVKHFAECIEALQEGSGKEKSIYNKLGMFLKGDYEAAILGKPILRSDLDPLGEDILDTIDEYRSYWLDLVGRLRDRCGLACSGFWTYGGSPLWGVSFSARGKRPLAIFTLGSNYVFIEFTLPVDAAETIIRERQSYSEPIRKKIETFHCVRCPKECKGSNIVRIDGVSLCKGRAEARRIYSVLSSPDDFESISAMLDIIC